MLIKNVKLNEDLINNEQIINNIFSLNDLSEFEEADFKIITRLKYYTGFNIVIEISPQLRRLLLSRGYVFVGWKKCVVVDHLRVIRCFKCSNLGHIEKDCKSNIICPNCSGDHVLESCQSDEKKCVNCINFNKRFKHNLAVDHSAKDTCCTVYKNFLEKLKARINYD